ncbi:hypothetical protein Chor_010479 [Crotalus horridus]
MLGSGSGPSGEDEAEEEQRRAGPGGGRPSSDGWDFPDGELDGGPPGDPRGQENERKTLEEGGGKPVVENVVFLCTLRRATVDEMGNGSRPDTGRSLRTGFEFEFCLGYQDFLDEELDGGPPGDPRGQENGRDTLDEDGGKPVVENAVFVCTIRRTTLMECRMAAGYITGELVLSSTEEIDGGPPGHPRGQENGRDALEENGGKLLMYYKENRLDGMGNGSRLDTGRGLENGSVFEFYLGDKVSLPPLVEGALRCFLKLTVSKILWMVAKPPASSLVRVRWWGETSNGTVFVPQDASQPEQKILNTTTCYPVRCGPKQFASYLADMGALLLEVMTKSDHLPIGRVQIKGLAQLSPSHPISGFFTIVSPSSEKMGELQGKRSLIFPRELGEYPEEYFRISTPPELRLERKGSQATKDLLDRGNRLRNAMAVSAMTANPDPVIELYEARPSVKQNLSRPAGKTLKNSGLTCEDPLEPLRECSEFDLDAEKKAIELLLGSDEEEEAVSSGKLSRPQGTKLQRSPKAFESSPRRRKGKALQTRASESTDEIQAVSLSLDRQALLGRIRLARVVIDSFRGVPPEDSAPSTHNPKSPSGKPPRPALAKRRTLFVEYHFPVGTSKNGIGQTAVTTEIVRVASSRFSADGVKFQQRHVFPVHFSGSMITHWWKSPLEFNLFLKKGTQRKPALIGTAAFPLRDVLRSEDLFVSRELPVKENGVPGQLGPLQVSVELVAANKDVSNIKASSASPRAPVGSVRSHGAILQEAESSPSSSARSPQRIRQVPARSEDPLPAASPRSPKDVGRQPVPPPVSRNLLTQMSPSEEEGVLLHVLLMVSEGQIGLPPNGGLDLACNLYLICKLFSTEEATRSAITPVALTSKHLERLKNNVMVIEYPVLAVDGSVDVVDVFSGQKNGTLKATLAMGSSDQLPSGGKERLVEHTFEVHIEGVQGLTPLQSTVWGEADCYVQYHFPAQDSGRDTLREAELSGKADVPVQRLLLGAFSAQSLAGEGGGIHFEIWCRYYYPNVRDQMVARARLPLSRLCAMVTMQHRQEVGVQAFRLPAEQRRTRTVARSFCPTFGHHVELPCRLVVQRSSGEACCLGELLQGSEMVFQLYHQPLNPAPRETQTLKDCLLGTVRVPARDLLIRRSGQTHLNKSVYCYLRYKLYDQEAAWTSLRRPKTTEGEKHVTVTFKNPNHMELQSSPALCWYFREEKLELQVWRAYGKDGVFPLFRRNAANLGGAGLRVHIAVTPAGSSGGPGNSEDDRDSSNSNSVEEKKAAEQQLEVRTEANPPVDELPQEKPPGVFLALVLCTLNGPPIVPSRCAPILRAEGQPHRIKPDESIERLPHISPSRLPEQVKEHLFSDFRKSHAPLQQILAFGFISVPSRIAPGSPLAERGVTSPSSYVSFVATDADNPFTTATVENTDSPVWDFHQQTRLSKELLLDSQKTLVFKVWHKADVERVMGFASVDLSPLLCGFQHICGWYNVTDLSGQCRGQVKVAVCPLENIAHLKGERQAKSCQRHGQISKFSMEEEPRSFRSCEVRQNKRTGSRYKEHVQNVRRFHTSLQQAEENTDHLGRLDSLSGPSQMSLFRALRKNLNELDEIQRYFSEKLTRPFTDLNAPGSTMDGLDIQRAFSKGPDPEGDHLQKKPTHLVSQVSSQNVDLWPKRRSPPEESSLAHGDVDGFSSAEQALLEQRNGVTRTELLQALPSDEFLSVGIGEEALLTLPKSPSAEDVLYEFFDPAHSRGVLPSCLPDLQREEDPAQSHSEEEYEEAVVEPRTLNEITTVTDRTSPWSSFVSETEQEPIPEANVTPDGGSLAKESALRSSCLSNGIHDDPSSVSSLAGSGKSPFREEDGDGVEERQDLDAGEDESSATERAEPGEIQTFGQGRPPKVPEAGLEDASSTQQGGDFVRPPTAAPEAGEGPENRQRDPQQEEGSHGKGGEGLQPCPASQAIVQQAEASSGEDDEDLPEEFSAPTLALYPFFALSAAHNALTLFE